MSGLSHEEFIDICKTKFDFGHYLDACIKYYDNGSFDKFDAMTGEPVAIPEDVKHLFSVLKIASQTELGAKLFRELDENTKVTFVMDESEKNNAYGYSSGNHLIALTDIERNPSANAATMLHELTHEVQKQQGGNSRFLPTEQDRFMTNKMMEAEARLNTVIATHQILLQDTSEEDKRKFVNSLNSQVIHDWTMYRALEKSGASQEEITRQMLQSFYRDPDWNQNYNRQAQGAAGYEMSGSEYLANNTQHPETVQRQYMKRMGLSEEDEKFFFNPENISNYPVGQIKEKSERIINIDENLTQKNTYENGELIYKAIFNGDKLLSEDRIINDVTVSKKYDDQGKLSSSSRAYTDSEGQYHKIYQTRDKEPYEIIKDKEGRILKVSTLDGKEVSNTETLNREYSNVHQVFEDIKSNKEIPDEALQKAYNAIQNDQFGLYDGMRALQQTISNEAEKRETSVLSSEQNISENNDLKNKRSEEIILDEMLRAGKLTREQEDKILEMAIFIEQKRAKEKEQGIQSDRSYAEQFIDKMKDSNDFSAEQKDIALNAAIKAESMERPEAYDRIRQLRGITTQKSSSKVNPTELSETLSPILQMQAIKNNQNS